MGMGFMFQTTPDVANVQSLALANYEDVTVTHPTHSLLTF